MLKRLIKIPGGAYGGNTETFLERYSVLEHFLAGSFELQKRVSIHSLPLELVDNTFNLELNYDQLFL
jgi:hypothetical protein